LSSIRSKCVSSSSRRACIDCHRAPSACNAVVRCSWQCRGRAVLAQRPNSRERWSDLRIHYNGQRCSYCTLPCRWGESIGCCSWSCCANGCGTPGSSNTISRCCWQRRRCRVLTQRSDCSECWRNLRIHYNGQCCCNCALAGRWCKCISCCSRSSSAYRSRAPCSSNTIV
jgi:hypothetical protein